MISPRRLFRLWRLALLQVRATPSRSSIASLGIAIGTGMLIVVVGLGIGVREVVLDKIVQRLPLNMVEVLPRTLDLGLFKANFDLFGTGQITQATIDALATLPDVAAVYPKTTVKLPLGARGGGGLFGRRMYAELFMVGLEPELVADHVDTEKFREDPASGVVPILISDQLLEVYNQSVAPSLGTPRLTAAMLMGFEFDIQVGRSLMLGSKGARTSGSARGRVVGVSPYALRLGVSVPTKTAERLLKKYAADYDGPAYTSVILRAESVAQVPALCAAVESMGLNVDESAADTSDLLLAGMLIASLVAGLVMLLAALNIAHTFFASLSERRREMAILRALGARRLDLLLTVCSEAAIIGLLGALLGMVGATLLCAAIDYGAAQWLPDFPFKPESFFVVPLWLYLSAAAAAVGAAVGGALWPTIKTARAPLTRELTA